MRGQPEVLVLTLFCGENELEACLASVSAQRYPRREQWVIRHLPNREAHDRLYRTIVENRDRYDLFLKLDADMVLVGEDALERLVEPFGRNRELDHLVVGVADSMTGGEIIGAHVFSRRVVWPEHDDPLHVDPDPSFPGDKLVVAEPRPALVYHMPDPSPRQAFRFGVHRGLKAVQPFRPLWRRRAHGALVQWGYLCRLWANFAATGESRLGLALLGADLALRRRLPSSASEASSEALEEAFLSCSSLPAGEIRQRLVRRWGRPARRTLFWVSALGPAMAAKVLGRLIRDALAARVKPLVGRGGGEGD